MKIAVKVLVIHVIIILGIGFLSSAGSKFYLLDFRLTVGIACVIMGIIDILIGCILMVMDNSESKYGKGFLLTAGFLLLVGFATCSGTPLSH